MSNFSFKENFYGKYEELHKRFIMKNSTFENLIELFSKLQMALRDFSKTINNIVVKDCPLFPEQNSTQNEAIEYIKFILTIQTTQFNIEIDLLKSKIIDVLKAKKEENFKKEKELYIEFKKMNTKYNDSLINLQKMKEKFFQSANLAEMSTKSAKEISLRKLNNNIDKKQQNLNNMLEQRSLEALNEAKRNDEKYKESIKEVNNNGKNNINKQYELLNFYQENEYNDFKLYKSVLLDYLCHLKTENSLIKENLIEMEEKICLMNLEKDLKILKDIYTSNQKPEKPIAYQMYSPKINIENCFKDEEYKLFFNIISTMKSYITILPDFNLDKETKKEELRELCKIFYSLNINYDENIIQKILDYLKEEWAQEFFLIILSKQRTNGRYCRTKKLILDLATILNLIIDISYNTLNYTMVKTCIILSQTFYFESPDKKSKVYLLNYIKNNKWLKMPDFWRNIINLMILGEIKKISERTNEPIKKENLDNILFSQILSYSSNMKDFQIDKRIILKIIDEFMKKYEVSKEFCDLIYNNIGDEKYVENLRKEYLSTPDLEQKILDEIQFEINNEKQEKLISTKNKEDNEILEKKEVEEKIISNEIKENKIIESNEIIEKKENNIIDKNIINENIIKDEINNNISKEEENKDEKEKGKFNENEN